MVKRNTLHGLEPTHDLPPNRTLYHWATMAHKIFLNIKMDASIMHNPFDWNPICRHKRPTLYLELNNCLISNLFKYLNFVVKFKKGKHTQKFRKTPNLFAKSFTYIFAHFFHIQREIIWKRERWQREREKRREKEREREAFYLNCLFCLCCLSDTDTHSRSISS